MRSLREPALTFIPALGSRLIASMFVQTSVIQGFKGNADLLQWEQATIRGLGWSDKEELLIVSEDGTVRRYFGLDGEFTSFSLGNVRIALLFRSFARINLTMYRAPKNTA